MAGALLEGKHTGKSPELEAYRRAITAGRAGSYWFVALVGLRSQDPLDILKRVEKGLAFSALERFQRNSGLSTNDLAEAVVIKLRTLHRRKEQGRLEPGESDRLLRVSRVFGRALELFEGDVPAALAAYNGGPGNARRWSRDAASDPDLFLEEIDLPETESYLRLVSENLARYRQLYASPDTIGDTDGARQTR